MRERIVRHNDMARALADLCRQHESLELLLEPTLSVCCFRYRSAEITDLDKLNQKLFWRLIRENEFIPSTTRVNGQLAIRPCFLGARIESDQVDGLVQAVLRIGAELVDELTLSGHVPD
jgi:aromatic-L-amino-acid decarboxylase